MTWYEQLFGLQEAKDFRTAQKNFKFDEKDGVLTSTANGKSYAVGRFETASLHDLRMKGIQALATYNGSAKTGFAYSHIAQGDILSEHAKYPGALFQAASQFNCLEFPSDSVVPEDGVTNYMYDGTQGPACSLACAAGTVVRNYFVNVPQLASGEPEGDDDISLDELGQRADCQINNLQQLETALCNDKEHYFSVRNGYTFSRNRDSLHRLGSIIQSSKEGKVTTDQGRYSYEDLKGLLKIGVHSDVGVTFSDRYIPAPAGLTVTQAYCSALSCAYSGLAAAHWEPFARLILEAAYEATLWAAVLNALRQLPSQAASSAGANTGPSLEHKNKVFLTFLGGGVFGNDMTWICDAIGRAMAVVASHQAPIEVHISHYRVVRPEVVQMVDAAYQRELRALQNPGAAGARTGAGHK